MCMARSPRRTSSSTTTSADPCSRSAGLVGGHRPGSTDCALPLTPTPGRLARCSGGECEISAVEPDNVRRELPITRPPPLAHRLGLGGNDRWGRHARQPRRISRSPTASGMLASSLQCRGHRDLRPIAGAAISSPGSSCDSASAEPERFRVRSQAAHPARTGGAAVPSGDRSRPARGR